MDEWKWRAKKADADGAVRYDRRWLDAHAQEWHMNVMNGVAKLHYYADQDMPEVVRRELVDAAKRFVVGCAKVNHPLDAMQFYEMLDALNLTKYERDELAREMVEFRQSLKRE
jgi:hypothetical protein